MALKPRMKRTLNILLPTTLPRAISGCPLKVDCKLTASSGELVPNDTTVKPTTRGEIPSEEAMRDAPLTSKSAPNINNTSPAPKIRKVIKSI